jgi:hypothetical protein
MRWLFLPDYIALHSGRQYFSYWIINWKWRGRTQLWPNLRYYPGICQKGLKIPRETSVRITGLRAHIWIQDLLNRKQVLSPRQRHLVGSFSWISYKCISQKNRTLHIWSRNDVLRIVVLSLRTSTPTDYSNNLNKKPKITFQSIFHVRHWKLYLVPRIPGRGRRGAVREWFAWSQMRWQELTRLTVR